MLEVSLKSFVHVMDGDEIVVQSDGIPADGLWPTTWWQPGQLVQDPHALPLSGAFDLEQVSVVVGLYDERSKDRLPAVDPDGRSMGDSLILP